MNLKFEQANQESARTGISLAPDLSETRTSSKAYEFTAHAPKTLLQPSEMGKARKYTHFFIQNQTDTAS